MSILTKEAVAKICHEANRALCTGLGDFSQPTWEGAPEWQKQSAITGVQFNLDNPDAPASASHDSWLEEKRKDGWKYGPIKLPDHKEHPCFIPYEGLPLDQQVKDHLFKAIVAAVKPIISSMV